MRINTGLPQNPFLLTPLSYDEARSQKGHRAYPKNENEKAAREKSDEQIGSKPNKNDSEKKAN